MARSPQSLPGSYPQPLAAQILKADGHRQASMLRQEIATDLLAVLNDAREPGLRARVLRLVEKHLKAGLSAAAKARELWPALAEVREILAPGENLKPAAARKHIGLFEQFDKVHHRSLELLDNSFEHIRVILDRLQPTEPGEGTKPGALNPAA